MKMKMNHLKSLKGVLLIRVIAKFNLTIAVERSRRRRRSNNWMRRRKMMKKNRVKEFRKKFICVEQTANRGIL